MKPNTRLEAVAAFNTMIDLLKERTNIGSNYIDEVLRLPAVSQVISAGGWSKATRKVVGLPGKGYVLTRNVALAA